jgi:hypothetical protein
MPVNGEKLKVFKWGVGSVTRSQGQCRQSLAMGDLCQKVVVGWMQECDMKNTQARFFCNAVGVGANSTAVITGDACAIALLCKDSRLRETGAAASAAACQFAQ